jgi:hypothetical protein
VESLQGTGLAGQLDGVNVLVTTVVSGTWVTLRVLVGHWGSQCIENGAGSDILGGNEDDGLALTLDLEFLFASEHSASLQEQDVKLTMISAISGSVSSRDFSSIYKTW